MDSISKNDVSAIRVSVASGLQPTTHPTRSLSTSVEAFSFAIESSSPRVSRQGSVLATCSVPQLIERYRFEKLLGKGGFGEVWKAFDNQAQRYVAIKGPRTDRVVTTELVQNFLDEAERAKQLAGTSIVPVLDVMQMPARREGEYLCFIVMQWMEGGSLGDRCQQGDPPTPRMAVKWIASLADSLAQIHSHGYVHRDIKPDNILFDADGRPFFSDFGLAASLAEQFAEDRIVVGTVTYMAPEQARQQRVDRQADIYSLGVVLYQLLALPYVSDPRHALPYLATNNVEYLETLRDSNQQVRALPEGVPSALAEIVEQRCLKNDKSQRYRTAADLSRDLRQWLRAGQPLTRRRLIVAGGGLAAVALAGGGYAAWSNSDGGESPPVPGADAAIHLENLLERAAPDPAHWSVNRSLTALTIHTSEPALIAFGTHQDEATEFELTLRQEQWTGLFGMFFGHQWAPNERRIQYQAVLVFKKSDGSLVLRGNTYDYDPADPAGVHSSNQIVEWKIEKFQPHGCSIGIQINGQLSGVSFNGSDLGADFVQQWQQSLRGTFAQGRGQFGALALEGPGSFHNTLLNRKTVLIRQ